MTQSASTTCTRWSKRPLPAGLRRDHACDSSADRRAHLDLQINLLAEQESTATLRLLGRIAERLGLEPEQAVKKEQATLEAETDIKALVTELDKKLP